MARISPSRLALGVFLLGFAAALSEDTCLSDEPRLNIVFILADDLGWGEVGCFGQEKIPTPHLDRLAGQGVRLTQHYSGAPVCAPSRCVLLTGQHLGHAEIRGNLQAKVHFPEFSEGQHPLSAEALTMARVFQQAGYATGAIGKWGLGPVGSSGDPNRHGFDLFFGYNCQAVAHSFYPASLWRNARQVPLNAQPIPGHQKQPDGEVRMSDWIGEAYAPHTMIQEAESFIADHAHQPFFLYLPLIEPHVAMHPPAELVERFPLEWDTEVYRGEAGYLPHPRPRAAYAAMIFDLDRHVGRVMQALENAGVAENTLVIFSSDNGPTLDVGERSKFHVGGADPKFFNSTRNLRGYKGSVYEGGLRVPTIVRLPSAKLAGTTNESPSYFADWFPTLCAAANLPAPSGLDGESLWMNLTQPAAPLRRQRPMVWVFPEYSGQVAVRFDDWKLVRRGLRTRQPGPWELYDLSSDQAEAINLADSQGDVVARGIQILLDQTRANEHFPVPLQ